MNLEFFVISLLNGVSYGLLLFMLSSGLTLIFSMMGVLNFAHTSFYMLGAYFAYTLSGALGFWPALVLRRGNDVVQLGLRSFMGTEGNDWGPLMATAGRITVVEVEEIVPPGELPPSAIHTPGIYVDRLIVGQFEKRIEQRTLRAGGH